MAALGRAAGLDPADPGIAALEEAAGPGAAAGPGTAAGPAAAAAHKDSTAAARSRCPPLRGSILRVMFRTLIVVIGRARRVIARYVSVARPCPAGGSRANVVETRGAAPTAWGFPARRFAAARRTAEPGRLAGCMLVAGGVWSVWREPERQWLGGRAVFSGLLFPCPAVRRVAGRGLRAPRLSRRGLDRVGNQGPGPGG